MADQHSTHEDDAAGSRSLLQQVKGYGSAADTTDHQLECGQLNTSQASSSDGGVDSQKIRLLGPWKHLQRGDYRLVIKHYIWKRAVLPNLTILCFLLACFFVFLVCGIFVWDHFTWKAWYALSVTAITFALLIKNIFDPSVTMIFSTTMLVAAQIVTPKAAISGER